MLPPIASTPQPLMRDPSSTPLPKGTIADGYNNPEGTSPYPAPDGTVRPVGYWESEVAGLTWERGETTYRAPWNSTEFDLRPDLRGANSRELDGVPINRSSAAQLWIAVAGLTINHAGMRVLLSHWGHPVNFAKIAQFTPWADVTADITTGTDLGILNAWPPGSGYQMRYWQVKLRFQFPLQFLPASLPPLSVQGGVY